MVFTLIISYLQQKAEYKGVEKRYRHPAGAITVKRTSKSNIRVNFIRSKMEIAEYCSTNSMAQRWLKRVNNSWRERLAREERIVPSVAKASRQQTISEDLHCTYTVIRTVGTVL